MWQEIALTIIGIDIIYYILDGKSIILNSYIQKGHILCKLSRMLIKRQDKKEKNFVTE